MEKEFINLTPENLDGEHLCCIIRSRKPHPGVEAKRRWLAGRLEEGHVFRKLDEKGAVFVEYAPLETAWVPVTGDNYLYLYCLWAAGAYKGKGCGRALMEYCLADAGAKGKSGVCMLGAQKQKAWLSDQSFAKKYGFQVVDTAAGGYELLALSFDGTAPRFTDAARRGTIPEQELTIYYGMQCPYIHASLEQVKRFCGAAGGGQPVPPPVRRGGRAPLQRGGAGRPAGTPLPRRGVPAGGALQLAGLGDSVKQKAQARRICGGPVPVIRQWRSDRGCHSPWPRRCPQCPAPGCRGRTTGWSCPCRAGAAG